MRCLHRTWAHRNRKKQRQKMVCAHFTSDYFPGSSQIDVNNNNKKSSPLRSVDELSLLRNLEVSSALSSSNSSSLRSSPSLKSFDGEDNSTLFNEPNEPCRNANNEDHLLANDMHSKNTTSDILPNKKTPTQSTVTSAVTAITSNVNDASEHIVDTAPTSRNDENTSTAESQTKCEPSSAGNISPNENTSR